MKRDLDRAAAAASGPRRMARPGRRRSSAIDPIRGLWSRDPPIRVRARPSPIAGCRLTIREGRNRQVRRMTAAIGHPTLRLVRWRIGDWTVEGLAPGEWRAIP